MYIRNANTFINRFKGKFRASHDTQIRSARLLIIDRHIIYKSIHHSPLVDRSWTRYTLRATVIVRTYYPCNF